MKKIATNFIAVLFLVLPLSMTAQDFEKVDNIVKNYPKSFSSVEKLSDLINKDFKREDEKARAIFTWIATNVKYDLQAYSKGQQVAFSYKTEEEKTALQKKYNEELALKTLKTKKGVCQGYATLFNLLCEQTGLESVFIAGTSKSALTHIGKAPTIVGDHAWNAVKIDNQWKLVDVTWGAGSVSGTPAVFNFRFNDVYFFSEPDFFFLNHFPEDEKWLLTNKEKKEFTDLPLYYTSALKEKYIFSSPYQGSIEYPATKSIPFKIDNLQISDRISYSFSKSKKITEIQNVNNNGTAEFSIPLDNHSLGFLTIFINQKAVAAYRINRG